MPRSTQSRSDIIDVANKAIFHGSGNRGRQVTDIAYRNGVNASGGFDVTVRQNGRSAPVFIRGRDQLLQFVRSC